MLAPVDKLVEIEDAINSGELERACRLLTELRPVLVSQSIDELMLMKAKVVQMTLVAESQKNQHRVGLRTLARKRSSVAAYRDVQQT